ncbi:MAG: hypothetical protein ACTHLR_17155 [Rhizomicrobium sp.]
MSAPQRDNVGVRMGVMVKAGALSLAGILAAGSALAAPSSKCAKADEVTAIQVAAVQQELMVAALTCDQVTNFNAFQTGFGPELRNSDATLHKMFKRIFGNRQGEDEFHAFKTRLANDSSIRSIHDNQAYCHEAAAVFSSALAPAKPTLAAFVSGVTIQEQSPVNSCDIRVASSLPGLAAAGSTAFILPKPKPDFDGAATSTAAVK